jgi:hypothetical protein
MPARPERDGEFLRARWHALAYEVAGWPSHRSDPPPYEAYTAALSRLSEEIAEEARAEERERIGRQVETWFALNVYGSASSRRLVESIRSSPSPREPAREETG